MEALKKNHKKIISLKKAKKIIITLVVILFFEFLLFPAPSIASQHVDLNVVGSDFDLSINQSPDSRLPESDVILDNKLPRPRDLEIKLTRHLLITAYNSEAGQTDNSPCITANNFNVCENGVEDTIAANFLPFGAKVRIPELFGDKVFIVRDRMNSRFTHRVDVWMIEREDAVKFGVKTAKIEVLE